MHDIENIERKYRQVLACLYEELFRAEGTVCPIMTLYIEEWYCLMVKHDALYNKGTSIELMFTPKQVSCVRLYLVVSAFKPLKMTLCHLVYKKSDLSFQGIYRQAQVTEEVSLTSSLFQHMK